MNECRWCSFFPQSNEHGNFFYCFTRFRGLNLDRKVCKINYINNNSNNPNNDKRETFEKQWVMWKWLWSGSAPIILHSPAGEMHLTSQMLFGVWNGWPWQQDLQVQQTPLALGSDQHHRGKMTCCLAWAKELGTKTTFITKHSSQNRIFDKCSYSY